MKKSILTKIAAVFLTGTLLMQNPLHGLAATANTSYISDVMVSYAASDSEEDIAAAKKWLTSKGYKVLDRDLNQDADDSFSRQRSVYLGYKTTRKASEAITDMRLMHMSGDFSFDDYNQLLTDQRNEIGTFINNIKQALTGYREAYEEGSYQAQLVHENLNAFFDDDTGYKLGDLLLNPIREELSESEYDKNPDEYADMTTILMQGNAVAVQGIMQNLLYVADTIDTGETWLDRLGEIESIDSLRQTYQKENPAWSVSAVDNAMIADYDRDAIALADMIDGFKHYMENYTQCEVTAEDGEEAIDAYFKEHPEQSYSVWLNAGLYNTMLGFMPSGSENLSLYDLLMGEHDFSKLEDRIALYPLVASMTEAQRNLMAYNPLDRYLLIGLTDEQGWSDAYDNVSEKLKAQKSKSVYAGVNRALFRTNAGVALTKTARDHETMTRESYMGGAFSDGTLYWTIMLGSAAIVTMGAGIACLKHGNDIFRDHVHSAARYDQFQVEFDPVSASANEGAVQNEINHIANNMDNDALLINPEENNNLINNVKEAADKVDDVLDEMEEMEDISTYGTRFQSTNPNNVWVWTGRVLCIAAAIMALSAGAMAIVRLVQAYNVDYTTIPNYMVHGVEGENGWSYTYYNAVKCNRIEGGFLDDDSKVMADNADLNGDVGKEWVALYVTRDASGGQPIKAQSLTVSDKEQVPANSYALSYFGEEYAANLNNPNYIFNSGAGIGSGAAPIYLFYAKDRSAAATASVFSSGFAGLVGILSCAAGAACFYFISGISGKKRKMEAEQGQNTEQE